MSENIIYGFGAKLRGQTRAVDSDTVVEQVVQVKNKQMDFAGSGAPSTAPSPLPDTGVVATYIDYASGDVYVWSDSAWRAI